MSKFKPYSMKRICAAILVVSFQLQALTVAQAAVSQLPALYTSPPDSNVMFTLDDSGSMVSDAIPDFNTNDHNLLTDIGSGFFPNDGSKLPNMWGGASGYLSFTFYNENNAAARYLRSSAGNPLYYDRTVTYLPWPKKERNDELNSPANPLAVNIHTDNPFLSSRTINLKSQMMGADFQKFWPATYFVYTGSSPLPISSLSNNPSRINDLSNIISNFIKVEVKSTVSGYYRAATRTDCAGAVGGNGCTYDQEIQNFANWLQYYRSRLLMAKGGVASAFAKQGTNLRVGLGSINYSSSTGRKIVRQGISQFSGVNRTNFFTELYSIEDNGGTPLRFAMDEVGKYFMGQGVKNPWAEDPTNAISVGKEYSCRRSFHILSTDGFWKDADASSPANSASNDVFSGSTPTRSDGKAYIYSDTNTSNADPLVSRFSINPFADSTNESVNGSYNTLADVAAYYWKTDLRPDLSNNTSPTARDPAFWQHLTTFTVGLGVNGTGLVTKKSGGSADLTTQASRDLLVANRTPLNWTTPAPENAATGDDLIHASMNGRGRYFSATNPTELANGLASALAEAADTPVDLAAVAADSPQVAASGVIYQGTFSPRGWYGRLYAFPQNAVSGSVNTSPGSATWEASNKMPAPSLRNIYTVDTTGTLPTGKLFTWANLTATQQSDLNNDSTLLDYLRGSSAKELANKGSFRDRVRYTVGGAAGGVLGDIVNGAPIKGPDAGGSYDRLPSASESSAYATYRSGTKLDNLRDTIFVGANDGMLHAFNTNDGVERFAFVPNAVFSVPTAAGTEKRLAMLSDIVYPHRFLVDGPPNIADAYIGGQWKTLMAASTGAGAKALFVLDVTDPAVGSSGFGSSKVLWEFSYVNNTDMGHVLGYPHIVRMRNGAWAVIFGNGYDSQNGQAKLFILDAGTGALIREFAVGSATGNGLSMPNFVLNDKREVEAIYAGDLKGNLWKFDVSATSASSWAVAFSGQALFTTDGGVNQPITVMPEITLSDQKEGGALLTFGTGKQFEASDTATSGNVNLNNQAIYSIWDKPSQTAGITSGYSALKERKAPVTPAPPATAPANGEFQGIDLAITENSTAIDWSTKRGWYIKLSTGGERVNVNPQQFKRTVYLIANTPNTADPCALGGLSRIFAINPLTGLPPVLPVFDVNGDGAFTSADIGNILVNRRGVLTQPIFQLSAQTGLSITPSVSVSPLSIFDRGQATGGRSGGVELSRSFGGSLPTSGSPCSGVLSSGSSDTSVLTVNVNCTEPASPTPKNKRISWKQLM